MSSTQVQFDPSQPYAPAQFDPSQPYDADVSFSAAAPPPKSPVVPPGFWDDPKAFLENRAKELGDESQHQINLGMGTESQGKSLAFRLAHRTLSLVPETAALVDKMIAGGMDWKNAIVTAAGAVDPAIPAAYFGAHGAAQLTGVEPGVNAGDTSPENVQNALLAGAMVAGAGGAAEAPNAGSVTKAVKPSVRLAARATEAALNQKLLPVRKLANLSVPADVAEKIDIKIPGRDYGLEKPPPAEPGAEVYRDATVENKVPFAGDEIEDAPEPTAPRYRDATRENVEHAGDEIENAEPVLPPEVTSEARSIRPGSDRIYGPRPTPAKPIPARPGLALPPAPDIVGSPAAAAADNNFFQQARTQLGDEAPLSKVVQRAQDLKMGRTVVEPNNAEPAPSGESIPRTLSGESALRQVLTGQDNANLLKIAKSRGLNITREQQLRPGFADNLLINKIINDFSADELSNVRDTFLESKRNRAQFGDIGPEAWKTMSLQTYFPDLKISAAQLKRVQAAIEAGKQPAGDLTNLLRQSVDAAKKR